MGKPPTSFAEMLRQYMWDVRRPPITANRLARELGVTRQTVVNWLDERKRPSVDMLAKVADVMGRPLEELYAVVGYPVAAQDHLTHALAQLPPEDRERIARLILMDAERRTHLLSLMDACDANPG